MCKSCKSVYKLLRYAYNRYMKRFYRQSGFTLMELLVVIAILGVLIMMGLANFTTSQKKSRDIKRKNDLRQISLALETYYSDVGSYPTADLGTHIMNACGAAAIQTCEWGKPWKNTSVAPETIYMLALPSDPLQAQSYFYESTDGSYYKLYAKLENTLDADVGVSQGGYSNTDCGGGSKCTYGISSPNASVN